MERRVKWRLSLSCLGRHEGVYPPRVKSLLDNLIVKTLILSQKMEVNLICLHQTQSTLPNFDKDACIKESEPPLLLHNKLLIKKKVILVFPITVTLSFFANIQSF